MKRTIICACFLAFGFFAFGASTWEGSAVVAGAVDFPSDGLFGACNSFPLNSSVEVQNLENGKKIGIVITGNVENPAIFMALSPRAAKELGMKAGSSARVRVLAPAASSATPAPATASKAGESNDPDYNPRLLAAIAANPYNSADESAGKDFMSLLGAGYVPPQAASTGSAAQAPPPSGASAPASSPVVAEAKPSLLEASSSGSAAPKGATAIAVPPPQNPPLPESTGTAAKAPPTTATAALASPQPLSPESVSGSDTPTTPVTGTSDAVLAIPDSNGAAEAAPKAASLPAVASGGDSETKPQEALVAPAASALSSPMDTPLATPSLEDPSAEEALSSPGGSAGVAELTDPEIVLPEADLAEAYTLDPPEMSKTAMPDIALAEPPLESESTELAAAPVTTEPASGPETGPGISDTGVKSPGGLASAGKLPDPDLGPDLLPEALLDRMTNPEEKAPTIALADCEVDLGPVESPEALALEGKSPAAARPATAALADALAPAAPAKDGGEVVLSLQPTAPRPPEKTVPVLTSPTTPLAVSPSAGGAKAPVSPQPTPPSASAAIAPGSSKASVAVKPSGTPAKEPTDIRKLEAMQKGSFYVQIGLFGSEEALRAAISALNKQFPILYEKVEAAKGGNLYRLFVGPIKRDESGLVLTRVKALGYRDAVIKQG